jgi:hypothetical protein
MITKESVSNFLDTMDDIVKESDIVSDTVITEDDDIVIEESGGKKSDGGKLQWTIIPFKALEPVVRVLMFGAKKYGRENWRKVSPQRYKDALLRHVLTDEKVDKDTGEKHYAHAICCLLFLLMLDE